MFNVHFTPDPVRNCRDVRRSYMRLRRILDLRLITNGVCLKPENRYCLSLARSEDDVSTTIQEVRAVGRRCDLVGSLVTTSESTGSAGWGEDSVSAR
jgi:glutamate-1-semialdehyde aminotransferase